METQKPRETDLDERIHRFTISYDYENDPAVTLVDLVRKAGDFLGYIVGSRAVDVGMKQVIGGLSMSGESSWRDDLDDGESGAYSEWPLGQMLHNLSAFAQYGIDLEVREHETEDQVDLRLRKLVEEADSFLNLCPLDVWLGKERAPQLETTVLLARNRWALDHDHPIEPEALAIFGGVKMSRMRNMLSGKNPELSRVDGRVPAHEARQWLEGRESFYPSIWREARPNYDPAIKTSTFYEPIFVPQARDGSVFHPGLARRNGYTIGEKGNEFNVLNFNDALTELQEMPVPAWRQPAQGRGGWSIVRGVSWARTDQAELDSRARSELEVIKLAENDPDDPE